jgi:hypothetical protein
MLHVTESYQCPSLEAPKIPKENSPSSKSKKGNKNDQKDDGDDQEDNNEDSDSSDHGVKDPSKISTKSSSSKSNIPDTVLDSSNIRSTEYSIQHNQPASTDNQQPQLLLTAPKPNIPVNPDPPQIECISCSDPGADTSCVICGNNIHKKCSVVDTSDICSDVCKEKSET